MKSGTRTIKIKTNIKKTTAKTTAKTTKPVAVSLTGKTIKHRTAKKVTKKILRSLLLSPFFQTTVKLSLFVALVLSVTYGAYALVEDTVSTDVIVSKSEVVKRVTSRISLPEGEPEAVVRVEDAENLKKQNDFYGEVKEGDYILVYKKLAVIYDLRNDVIIGVKKVN